VAFSREIDPNSLFRNCYENVVYVDASVDAIAVMGSVFGYYLVRLKSFDSIFAKVIKVDFILTAMYFGAALIAPAMPRQSHQKVCKFLWVRLRIKCIKPCTFGIIRGIIV
jgi:hypothetical protein